MNTFTVAASVTPVVLGTAVTHYLNRKPLKQKPTAHLSYDEGLHLIRQFLAFASHHTVEDIQSFTAQWVPHPQWVKVNEIEIPEEKITEAATAIQDQLGADGIRQVGGRTWWQWRRPKTHLSAEWIEMKADYNERKRNGDPGKRVMLYVHGGAYFFGSVDEHRYQMQRHARKLKARVLAPKYRLSPQFPFPCGLLDCLAAYLWLLTVQDPSTIVLAGDSAGGGMVLSLLVVLRDRGIPLPAGAVLISPWVDLTHSFPSVASHCPYDYIPQSGFHHKPSKAWPPLNHDEYTMLREQVAKQAKLGHTKLMKPASTEMKRRSMEASKLEGAKKEVHGEAINGSAQPENFSLPEFLTINIDGQEIQLKDQMQLYTTNEMLAHPLVSPVLQPTLGGLPPLLIMVGGGEILRDEQIYLAHKCANPSKYTLDVDRMHESAKEQLARFKPTDVQLQVWDDLCHVAPTLSFTRPAKYMYRSVAQFGAWALARAQHTDIDILDDDDISVISNTDSDPEGSTVRSSKQQTQTDSAAKTITVGKAGDELPPFRNHMIRQQIDRHGNISPLAPASELPACNLEPRSVGMIKEGPVRRWLETRRQWDNRFGSARAKVHKRRLKEMIAGYDGFDGEMPPPSALAGRRKAGDELVERKKKKSLGLAMWAGWGSKHDEQTVTREQEAENAPEVKVANEEQGENARKPSDLKLQEEKIAKRPGLKESRSASRRRIVRDEQQTTSANEGIEGDADEVTPLATLMAIRSGQSKPATSEPAARSGHLSPDYVPPETGVAGKRPIVDGIAVPFSLNKDAETASMITLTSHVEGHPSRSAGPSSSNPARKVPGVAATGSEVSDEAVKQGDARPTSPAVPVVDNMHEDEPVTAGTPRASRADAQEAHVPAAVDADPDATPTAQKSDGLAGAGLAMAGGVLVSQERPPLETFVTAQEDLPKVK